MTEWMELMKDFAPRYYGFRGEVLTAEEWVELTMRQDRHVGDTHLRLRGRRYWVSTVLLGRDAGWGRGHAPLIFETMVFADGSWTDLYTDRYATLAQARRGHRAMIRQLRKAVAEEPRPRQLLHNGRKP